MIDFSDYQRLAHRTARKDRTFDHRLVVCGLGITGEAGEVADYIKKAVDHGHDLDRDKLIKELGDVMWYLAETCTLLDVAMEDVAEANIRKLENRYPEGFSEARSRNREEYHGVQNR